MKNSTQGSDFLKSKIQFFNSLPKGSIQDKLKYIEVGQQSEQHPLFKDYSFLLHNRMLIEAEFKQLFAAIKNESAENKHDFWLFCYHLAILLESDWNAYSQKNKEAEYTKLKQEIKNRLLGHPLDAVSEERFIESIEKTFLERITSVLKASFHLSRLREIISIIHISRITWLFSRLTLEQANQLGFIPQFLENLDKTTTFNQAIQTPINVAYYLSVILLVARLGIDVTLLIRHTFFPSEAEMKSSKFERFKYEFNKRQFRFANDIAWASVNFITNFLIVNPTHPLYAYGGLLTALFLIFDFGVILYASHRETHSYLKRKEEYHKELEYYSNKANSPNMSEEKRLEHINMIRKQLEELDINWRTKKETFQFLAAGAFVAMGGFALALIPGIAPSFVLVFYALGMVGLAMYLSENAFTNYREKSLRLDQEKNSIEAQQERDAAKKHFIFDMAKHLIVPPLLISAFALYIPAGIALTVMYLGYELLTHAYSRNKKQNAAAQTLIGSEKETAKIPELEMNKEQYKVSEEDKKYQPVYSFC